MHFVFVFIRKAKKNPLKNGNITTQSEKETYMELNERDNVKGETTHQENYYDSLSYPNNYNNKY